MIQQPSIGRMVHYCVPQTAGKDLPTLQPPRAATITEVPGLLPEQPNSGPEGYVQAVHLTVMHPLGFQHVLNVHYAETPTPGCWSWPPRV